MTSGKTDVFFNHFPLSLFPFTTEPQNWIKTLLANSLFPYLLKQHIVELGDLNPWGGFSKTHGFKNGSPCHLSRVRYTQWCDPSFSKTQVCSLRGAQRAMTSFEISPAFANGVFASWFPWFSLYLVEMILERNSGAERRQAAYATCNSLISWLQQFLQAQ